MDLSHKELLVEIDDKIAYGSDLIEQLTRISNIDGVAKMQRKIKQEINFLKKLKLSQKIKKEQLSSSNLRHLAAVVECALRPGVVSVNKVLQTTDGNKVSIDVINENGQVWTKVIARNPKSLSAVSDQNAPYGTRSVLDQADDYLNCAVLHPYLYQTPQVVFEFVSGIEDVLALKLQKRGIVVKGSTVTFDKEELDNASSDESDEDLIRSAIRVNLNEDVVTSIPTNNIKEVHMLNLDVTTMMAYVSNLTNGHYNFVFKQPLLSQQAIWEAKTPVKPILEKHFKDHNLVCCQVAWDSFEAIVRFLGGPNEKIRTAEFKKRLTIMPDEENGPDDAKQAELKAKGRISLRSKLIFNFGQRIRAITISANSGLVRSAKQQGVSYAVIIHESRALTELKESTATKTAL